MKRLILTEIISVTLVLATFLIVFSLFNGWEKTGQERYEDAIFALIAAAIIVSIFAAITAAFAAVAAITAIVTTGAIFAATFAVVGIVPVVIFTIFIAIAVNIKTQKINASEKVIWLSLTAETAAIIVPIIRIVF